MAKTKTIKIEQTGSAMRRHHSQRETLIGLGLNKIGRVKELPDTPETRGMLQTARSGVRIKGFEGGQMPLHRRLPKRGFNKPFQLKLHEVNLDRVQQAIDAGKLDVDATVDAAAMIKAGLLRRAHDGVRLLGNGELKAKVAFSVWGASKSAVQAVEKTGGSVT